MPSERAAMTRQRAESDALIFFASSSVSPVEPVFATCHADGERAREAWQNP